jgi:Fe2+ or Zn2+ uptake regulation protein
MNSRQLHILGLLAMNPGGLSASELRTQIRPQVSQPTLWRRLDELRAAGRVRMIGHGRSTRYVGATSGHAIADLRSKALHKEVGKKLLRQPQLLEVARRRLEKMRVATPYAQVYVERWEHLLSGPIEYVLQVLGADDEDSSALRHASPFAGVLTQQERLAALRRQGLMR